MTKNKIFIYFIESEKKGPIKIGHTTNIKNRLFEIQHANAKEINLLCLIPGNIKLEAKIQKMFYFCHIHGEWFFPSEEIYKFISEQKSLNLNVKSYKRNGKRPENWRDMGKLKI